MTFFTSAPVSCWFLVATVFCIVVTGVEISNPSVVDRQSKQLYVVPSQFYNYYNPYGLMPIVYPNQASAWPISTGESVSTESEDLNRNARIPIQVLPATTECVIGNIATQGLTPCTKTSGGKHGSILIKLPVADQIAVIGIVRSSNERITLRCSKMTAVAAFTKTGQITAPSDTPRTEIGALQLVVTSTAANGLVECMWHS